MSAVLQSPFFLLFCVTTGVGAYLGHRLCVRGVQPTLSERLMAVVAAMLSLALSALSYRMRVGLDRPVHIDPAAAGLVAAVTGLGIAFVCLKCVLSTDAPADH